MAKRGFSRETRPSSVHKPDACIPPNYICPAVYGKLICTRTRSVHIKSSRVLLEDPSALCEGYDVRRSCLKKKKRAQDGRLSFLLELIS